MSEQTIRGTAALSAADHEQAAMTLIVAANEALERLKGFETPVIVTIGQTFQAAELQAMLAISKRLGTLVAEVTEGRIVQIEVGQNIDRLANLLECVVDGPGREPTDDAIRTSARFRP